jgi:hypothetical protein
MHFCAEFYKSALLLGPETHSLSTTLISDRVAFDNPVALAPAQAGLSLMHR